MVLDLLQFQPAMIWITNRKKISVTIFGKIGDIAIGKNFIVINGQ